MIDKNEEHSADNLQVYKYLEILKANWKKIIGLSFLLTLVSVLFVLSITPRYTATANLLVEVKSDEPVSIERIVGLDNNRKEYFLTQIMKRYPGYVAYIFPKSKKITAGLFTSKSPNPTILKNMWEDFVKFWNLDHKIKPSYSWIPFRDFNKPIARKNILLVGDAAGLTDPFTGEGIYYAFINGEIASKQILNYFRTKNYNLAVEYNKNINSKLFDVLKWAEGLTTIFNHFPNLSFWFGAETSVGNDIIIPLITGELKYNEISKILNRSFKHNPLSFFKKK